MTINKIDINFNKALLSNDREEKVDIIEFNYDPELLLNTKDNPNSKLTEEEKLALLNNN